MGKTVFAAVVVVAMLFAAVPAIASDKNRGWFVYGIFEHETLKTGITTGGMLSARNALFGIGAEKTFQHRFLRRLTLEVMAGSATVEERQEYKRWSGGVLVEHTIRYLTHRHSGRLKASLAADLDIGKGWIVMPKASWSNSWMQGMSQSEYAIRVGKRF